MIKTYFDVLDADRLHQLRNLLDRPHWSFGHVSNDINRPIWGYEKKYALVLMDYFRDTLKEYEIFDIHVNGQTLGQQGSIHVDTANGATHSFVYFPDDWNYIEGGRLHIFDGRVPKIFTPQSNFGVLFAAQLEHYAEAPTVNKLRRSVGLKMRRK